MAFMNNGSFGGNNNQQGGEKKRSNFKLGKIWGTDGQLDVSVWIADTGARTILSIKSAVGKDPSTGSNVYEQKMPNELPRFFMTGGWARALVEAVKDKDPGTLNLQMEKPDHSKLSIVGQGNCVKLTIESPKSGTRTITLESVSVGNTTIHSEFLNLIDLIKVGQKKALYAKVDPDEFSVALNSEGMGADDNMPF